MNIIIALLVVILIVLCAILFKPHRVKILAIFKNGMEIEVKNVIWERNANITNMGQLSFYNGQSVECPFAVTGIIPELLDHKGKNVDILVVEKT